MSSLVALSNNHPNCCRLGLVVFLGGIVLSGSGLLWIISASGASIPGLNVIRDHLTSAGEGIVGGALFVIGIATSCATVYAAKRFSAKDKGGLSITLEEIGGAFITALWSPESSDQALSPVKSEFCRILRNTSFEQRIETLKPIFEYFWNSGEDENNRYELTKALIKILCDVVQDQKLPFETAILTLEKMELFHVQEDGLAAAIAQFVRYSSLSKSQEDAGTFHINNNFFLKRENEEAISDLTAEVFYYALLFQVQKLIKDKPNRRIAVIFDKLNANMIAPLLPHLKNIPSLYRLDLSKISFTEEHREALLAIARENETLVKFETNAFQTEIKAILEGRDPNDASSEDSDSNEEISSSSETEDSD
jgi:hypothetical protein